MEQKSRKEQEQDKIVDLYDNISISKSFHDRALANLKQAEKEQKGQDSKRKYKEIKNKEIKNKEKITYIEEIRYPRKHFRKLVAAGFVAALLIVSVTVFTNLDGNHKKSVANDVSIPTPVQGKDIYLDIDENEYIKATPLPNGDLKENIEKENIDKGSIDKENPEKFDLEGTDEVKTDLEKIDVDKINADKEKIKEEMEKQVELAKVNNMLHLFITPSDGYEEVTQALSINVDKGALYFHNGMNQFEVYKAIETAENQMGTNLIVTKSNGESLSNLKDEYLMLCCVDEEFEQRMDVMRIPLTNMTYELDYTDQKLSQIEYIDSTNTVRGTFTLNDDQWIMDDDAKIQILATNVSNAYFSGDINQVKELVDSDDIIVWEEDIQNTMKPYVLKWNKDEVSQTDPFCVSCEFYAPPEYDSYSYLTLEMQYENGEYKVKSMGLEK